jgi:signal transduction histidine kinase
MGERWRALPYLLFAVGSMLLLLSLGILVHHVSTMERAQAAAAALVERQSILRPALWRLDSKLLSTVVAEQTALPGAYGYGSPESWPLLSSPADPEWVLGRFLLGEKGGVRLAPRLSANKDVAAIRVRKLQSLEQDLRARDALDRLLREPLTEGWGTVRESTQAEVQEGQTQQVEEQPQVAVASAKELQARQRSKQEFQTLIDNQFRNNVNFLNPTAGLGGVELGPLSPLWWGGSEERPTYLFLLRELRSGQQSYRVGVALDWPVFSAELLKEISDLCPMADLRPATGLSDTSTLSAVFPIQLHMQEGASAGDPRSPTGLLLPLLILVVVLALLACFWVLHRAIDLSARRARFLAAVTHELRSPLTTFRLYSQLLLNGAGKDEAKLMEYARTLDSESNRLARVLDSVLAYSRVETRDARAPDLSVFTIDDLMIELGPHLEQRALSSGFEIVYPLTCGDVRVRTDLRMVEQVLMNLVDNACKYAATAEDRRIVFSVVSHGNAVDLQVLDHGPGILEADRRRVFQAFERGAPHASGTIPGVGLGLALSRAMARAAMADLLMDPDLKHGLRMILRMPRAD